MTTQNHIYFVKGPDAEGEGFLRDDGFVVKAGSLARREIAPSARASVTSLHEALMNAQAVELHGESLRFVIDFTFESPSGAAAAVLGRTANGWKEWKHADGRTLHQVERAAPRDASPLLDENVCRRILDRHRQLTDEGKLFSPRELDRQYALFRERFGPQVLGSLDGEALLTFMHDGGNRDGLVYWLEFKSDEEFDTRRFGSIAGGSALKFRLFRRQETGVWQAGVTQGNRPEDITDEKAVRYAREHRDQLLRGCELLDALPEGATDADYAGLQDGMDELAPDVSRLAFGHKYFSLLFPEKLDDYNSADLQRFMQIKLGLEPLGYPGRYACGGRFVAAAREVGLRMFLFTFTLNALFGRVHRYWRVGTTSGSTGTSYWPLMRDRGRAAIGWRELGDLSWVEPNPQSRERLKAELAEKCPNHPTAVGRDASQLTQFLTQMEEGDVVLAADGQKILGVGRIAGEYEYRPGDEFAHQRPVEWVSVDEWQLPDPKEGLQSTVRALGKSDANLLAIERRLQDGQPEAPTAPASPPARPVRLSGLPGRIQSVLDRRGQVILYGPPGTGKTYWADRTARDLAALSTFCRPYEELSEGEKRAVDGDENAAGLVRLCCFHPAYGYEDFLEGYRPETVDRAMSFRLRDGVFKRLCKDAAAAPDRRFLLVVDEINRGDVPRIFGELLTVLEKDKRGKRITLPVSGETFSVPENVFLIGTMNTADRSISLLDAALRRRFGFVELMPDGAVLKDASVAGIPLRAWLEALNDRIRQHVGRDARNLQIGHSYLMKEGRPLRDFAALKRAVRDDVIPLLEEYCYEDYPTLEAILGTQLVDRNAQRVRHDLFEEAAEADLIAALLAPCPEITASAEAVASDEALLNAEAQEAADEDADDEAEKL